MTESGRQIGIFVAQTLASWVLLMLIGVVSIAIESPPYDGGLAAIGGAIICILTNVVVVTLGAGLRFFQTTGRWLETHGGVAIAVATGGLAAIVVSFLLGSSTPGRPDTNRGLEHRVP